MRNVSFSLLVQSEENILFIVTLKHKRAAYSPFKPMNKTINGQI